MWFFAWPVFLNHLSWLVLGQTANRVQGPCPWELALSVGGQTDARSQLLELAEGGEGDSVEGQGQRYFGSWAARGRRWRWRRPGCWGAEVPPQDAGAGEEGGLGAGRRRCSGPRGPEAALRVLPDRGSCGVRV